MPSHGDINMRTGGGRTPGNTLEIIYNSGGVLGADPDLTFNVQTNLLSVNGNVRISNSSNLLFGGGQSNTAANSHFAVTYNVTATSLDFIFLGA